MDEEIFETYSEWADDELIWGKGMYNWCRYFKSAPLELTGFDDSIEIPF